MRLFNLVLVYIGGPCHLKLSSLLCGSNVEKYLSPNEITKI